MQKKHLTILAYFAIVSGIILLGWGMYLVSLGKTIPSDLQTENEELVTRNISPDFDSLHPVTGGINLQYPNQIFFEGDVIKVRAYLDKPSDNLKFIVIFFTDQDYTLSGKSGKEIDYEHFRFDNMRRAIQLTEKTEPKFDSIEEISLLNANEETMITGYYILKNNSYGIFDVDGTIFHVYANIDRLQVETNQVLRESTESQDKSNLIFEGLSWIGIGVIPVLVGIDILLRFYFNESMSP